MILLHILYISLCFSIYSVYYFRIFIMILLMVCWKYATIN